MAKFWPSVPNCPGIDNLFFLFSGVHNLVLPLVSTPFLLSWEKTSFSGPSLTLTEPGQVQEATCPGYFVLSCTKSRTPVHTALQVGQDRDSPSGSALRDILYSSLTGGEGSVLCLSQSCKLVLASGSFPPLLLCSYLFKAPRQCGFLQHSAEARHTSPLGPTVKGRKSRSMVHCSRTPPLPLTHPTVEVTG